MLESPSESLDTAECADDRAALLEAQNTHLRAGILSRDQRIRLLEEALRLLRSSTYGPSRERLKVAAGQAELFNEIEASLDIVEAVGLEPELKATPLREEKPSTGRPGRAKLAARQRGQRANRLRDGEGPGPAPYSGQVCLPRV